MNLDRRLIRLAALFIAAFAVGCQTPQQREEEAALQRQMAWAKEKMDRKEAAQQELVRRKLAEHDARMKGGRVSVPPQPKRPPEPPQTANVPPAVAPGSVRAGQAQTGEGVAVPGNAAREANRDAAVGHPVQIADGKANPVSPSQPEQAKEQEPKESAQSTDASKPQPVKPKKGWQKDLGRDLRHFPGNLKDDVVGFVDKDNILENALVLGAGLSLAVVSKTTSWDRNVRNTFARRNERFGAATDVATVVGHPGTQFGLAALAYTYGEACKDYRAAETGRQLFEALSINGLLTLGLQITTNQPRPNGERMSFPSGHTSSSFAFAAVLDGVYGPWVGIPAYGVAGFIGAARLDARQHQLSDVLLGAALGYMVGRTVTKVHRKKAVLGFEVDPWVDEQSGGGGIQLRKKF